MTGSSNIKSKTLPSLSKRLMAMASSRKIHSSGYGKVEDQPQLFRPRINKRRSKSVSKSLNRRAWESHDGKSYFSPLLMLRNFVELFTINSDRWLFFQNLLACWIIYFHHLSLNVNFRYYAEGFISPTSSTEDLSSDNSDQHTVCSTPNYVLKIWLWRNDSTFFNGRN